MITILKKTIKINLIKKVKIFFFVGKNLIFKKNYILYFNFNQINRIKLKNILVITCKINIDSRNK